MHAWLFVTHTMNCVPDSSKHASERERLNALECTSRHCERTFARCVGVKMFWSLSISMSSVVFFWTTSVLSSSSSDSAFFRFWQISEIDPLHAHVRSRQHPRQLSRRSVNVPHSARSTDSDSRRTSAAGSSSSAPRSAPAPSRGSPAGSSRPPRPARNCRPGAAPRCTS